MTKNMLKNWRDAATLIIVSHCERNSFKVLMLKRSSQSKFMPNAYVFPGGVKEDVDFSGEWKALFNTYNSNVTKRNIKMWNSKDFSLYKDNENDCLKPELGFRITALRETFEESGILFATKNDGTNIVLSDPNKNIGGDYGTLKCWRKKVYESPHNFIKLFHTLKSCPTVHNLYEWSSWLTPVGISSRRFNTIFYITFITCIPDVGKGTSTSDNIEVTELLWDTPTAIWEKTKGNLPPPQIVENYRLGSSAKLSPSLTTLYNWSNWLTPTFHKKRFHARFFICFLRNTFIRHSEDNLETVNSVWLNPHEAIQQYISKEITLQIPQIYESNRLMKYPTFDELKLFAAEREIFGLDLWCPHKVELKDGFVITYPGDDFHNKDPNADSTKMPGITVDELFQKSTSLNRAELHSETGLRTIRNNVTWYGHPALGAVNLNDSAKSNAKL